MANQLRKLMNRVQIIGTVKDVNLEVKQSRKGNDYIKGYVEVTVRDGNKVNSIKVNVMCMESWKQYAGLQKVKAEYNTGDRVRINASIDAQEYCGRNGYMYYNTINSNSFTRDFEDNGKDMAIANVEMIITGLEQELKDNVCTGNIKVSAFTVDWSGKVIELNKLIVGEKLAEPFSNIYYEGVTAKMTIKINNYVEVKETEQEQETYGFGTVVNVGGSGNTYVNNFELIGGDMPKGVDVAYTQEEIAQAKRDRELAKATLMNEEPSNDFNTNTGFGDTNFDDKKEYDPFDYGSMPF